MSELATAPGPETDERATFIKQFEQSTPVATTTSELVRATATTHAPTAVPASEPMLTPAPPVELELKFLHPVRTSEVVFGISAIFVWLCMFTAGAFVGTEPFRKLLTDPGESSLFHQFIAWGVVLSCYTFTNVAFLSCLAGVIGKFSRRSLSYELATINRWTPAPVISFQEVSVLYAVAIARGWAIYLMLAAGLIILTSDMVSNPKQGDYIRLAGTVSVLGFLAGYDSDLFKRALDRVAAFSVEGQKKH